MSSPEEVERFEFTERDFENATTIRHSRQTKNEAIYGSFGAFDSDEGEDYDSRPSFGR